MEASQFKSCASELLTNAVQAGAKEVRVIIEADRNELLLMVINEGRVEELRRGMPGPESPRGRGIELTKRQTDDFLLLSTNNRVIVTIRQAKGARREEPPGH